MFHKYTQTYMTTSERHSEYTALSSVVCRLEGLKRRAVFCPRHEVKTVYCSRSDKQCESKHTGYWKSATHSGTVSDAHANCSYWHTFRAFRAWECCLFIFYFFLVTSLPILVYSNTNIINHVTWHCDFLLASRWTMVTMRIVFSQMTGMSSIESQSNIALV